MLVNLLCVFGGIIAGAFIIALCSAAKCGDCNYVRAVRSEQLLEEMDEETT